MPFTSHLVNRAYFGQSISGEVWALDNEANLARVGQTTSGRHPLVSGGPLLFDHQGMIWTYGEHATGLLSEGIVRFPAAALTRSPLSRPPE